MTPKQILDKMNKSEIEEMRLKYLEKYPEDKLAFSEGIISKSISSRVNKFIKSQWDLKNRKENP
jgi:hypothetical protein